MSQSNSADKPDKPDKPKKPQLRKTQAAWERILGEMPEPTRHAITAVASAPVLSPEALDYQRTRDSLPEVVQEQMDQLVQLPPEVQSCPKPRFCLCEMPDGDFPKVRIFKSVDGLSRHIGSLEGQDIAVWPFYGVPMRFTTPDKHKRRYLLLPGEQEAIPILHSPLESSQMVDVDLLDPEYQIDGWLGDPALSEGYSSQYFQGSQPTSDAKKKPKKKRNDDREDDDIELT